MYILTYDLGTSANKTSLIDDTGKIIAAASQSYGTEHPWPGWAEQNPDCWWAAVVTTTQSVLAQHPAAARTIAAIGVCGHMLGCLPVDGRGRALRPALIHSDSRATAQFDHLEKSFGAERIYQITGNRLDPKSTICKIMWLKDHESEIYEKASAFVQSKDYLIGCLTGRIGTDHSDASHTVLYDIRKKTWADPLLEECGIAAAKLPLINASADIVGYLTHAAAKALGVIEGIPVVAGGGDGACATVGAGVASPGEAYNCIGSSAWLAAVIDTPLIDPGMRIFNMVNLSPATYSVFGVTQCAGSAYKWIGELLGVIGSQNASYDDLDRLAAAAECGCQGVVFLPYLMGERSPIWDAKAKGGYLGLTLSHGREEMARAVLEGISYSLRSILDIFADLDVAIDTIRVIGGGARGMLFQHILSEVYGRKILIPEILEDATAYGAGIAAGIGAGIFKDYSVAKQFIKINREVIPAQHNQQVYQHYYHIYQSLYPCLKESFTALHDLSQSKL